MLIKIFAVILAAAGAYLFLGGGYLVVLGGSLYYALYGISLIIAAYLFLKSQRGRASSVLVAAFGVTLLWSFAEVGLSYWGLFPRLLAPLALALVGIALFAAQPKRHAWFAAFGAGLLAFVGFFALAFHAFPEVDGSAGRFMLGTADRQPDAWTAYARTPEGTRYSPKAQINRANVNDLQLAWTYRTGRSDLHTEGHSDQNTPLQVDGTLFVCTPANAIHAVDAITGKRKWVVDDAKSYDNPSRCRSLGFYRDAAATVGAICRDRIVSTTGDGRLRELDAGTGRYCPGFGNNGAVSLTNGIGQTAARFYFPTSGPLVAGDVIIVGGWVTDNQSRHEPSGVIRAFDVRSGALRWAWDLGNPAITREPPPGQTYTLGTPNMWTHAAYDEGLGLVYIPLGGAPPDYYSTGRTPAEERYVASLVALDVRTGRERWHFQTVHRDLWDYDLPSQPALVEMADDSGRIVPAVVQLTKRGEIFALDRRTGVPVTKVVERRVNGAGHVPDEHPWPTQPYSVGMPSIRAKPLTEAGTWGMSSFDQLLCRIDFHRKRYNGDFTPPGLVANLVVPSAYGGMNWGSASVDPVNHLMFVNDIRIPTSHRLMSRSTYDQYSKTHKPTPDGHGVAPMHDTPYGVHTQLWLSFLGVPCVQPPFGTLSAVDLRTHKIVWQRPADTAKNLGPLGLKLGIPMRMGAPTYAGTLATAGGLVFFAGGQDNYLRAFDAQSGKELWSVETPVGSSATPMTYVAPNGRQYIVLVSGGSAHSKDVGDYVLAYALPGKRTQ